MDYPNINNINKLWRFHLQHRVRAALREDIGKSDITTRFVIPRNKIVKAVLLVKEPCVVCGLDIARLVFKAENNKIKFKPKVLEGACLKKRRIIAQIEGNARAILTAERVALNFLSFLSGVATQTRSFVEAVRPYRVKIMDTRKTLPGLRELQKYAVRVGGGYNHRMRLDEMVLIKDNHVRILNSKSKILNPKQIQNLKSKIPKSIKFEIEVKNLREFKKTLKLKPDIIMLDNMSVKDIRKAVELKNKLSVLTHPLSAKLEVSGGVNLNNVRRLAATGVEMISVGALTHSVKAIDMSLEVL